MSRAERLNRIYQLDAQQQQRQQQQQAATKRQSQAVEQDDPFLNFQPAREPVFQPVASITAAVPAVAPNVPMAQGPPPFVPRRPRQDVDTGNQGRFKRLAVLQKEDESETHVSRAAGPEIYGLPTEFDAPALNMPQGERHISMSEAGIACAPGDRKDPLGFAKRFGITPAELSVLDKEVRYARFNPTANTLEKIEHIDGRLRNEHNLRARGVAHILYANGARCIWILTNGRFFFGPETTYLERMRATCVEEALTRIVDK